MSLNFSTKCTKKQYSDIKKYIRKYKPLPAGSAKKLYI